MYIDDLDNYLKEKFKKTPKLKRDFEPLVLSYFYGDYQSFQEIYDLDSVDSEIYVKFLDYNIEQSSINYIDGILNKYFKNRNLFKNIGLKFNSYEKLRGKNHVYSSLEELDDDMTKEIENSKILKFQNSFLKSYKYLANKETYEIFKELYYKKIKKDDIKKTLSKIKGLDTYDLNLALGVLLKNESIESYIENLKDKNIDIVSKEDNILIFEVNDYLSSKDLGSKEWCISYNEKYWKDYKREKTSVSLINNELSKKRKYKDNNVFFIIDKNKKNSDESSMIGVTTLPSGEIIFVNDKNDKNIINDFKLRDYFNKKVGLFLNKKKKNKIRIKKNDIFGDINEIKINSSNPMEDIIDYIEENKISDFEIETVSALLKTVTELNVTKLMMEDDDFFKKTIDLLSKTNLGFSSNILEKIFNDNNFQEKYKEYYYAIEDSIIYEESENDNFSINENMILFIGKNNKDGSFFQEKIIEYFNNNKVEKILNFLEKEKDFFLSENVLSKIILNSIYIDSNKMINILDYYNENIKKIKKEEIKIPFKGILNLADSSFFLNSDQKKLKNILKKFKNKINYSDKYFFEKKIIEYRERKDFCKKIETLKSLGLASNKEINIFLKEISNDNNFEFHPIDKILFKRENNNEIMSKEQSIDFLKKKYRMNSLKKVNK